MADVFSPTKRSQIMSKVRSRGNKATELRLIHIFRKYGIRGWRRKAAVFGAPDFVFQTSRLAVFVDGCFWHSCPMHGCTPASNRKFWMAKLGRNVKRDRLVGRELKQAGWRVLRVWQHELRNSEKVARRISRSLFCGPVKCRCASDK